MSIKREFKILKTQIAGQKLLIECLRMERDKLIRQIEGLGHKPKIVQIQLAKTTNTL